MVELLEDVADPATLTVYETGELCEVVAVNKDFTCDLMHDDYKGKSSFLYNVPYHSLSFVDEAIEMILHKISRIAAGNYYVKEHWDDIAGYAQLPAKFRSMK